MYYKILDFFIFVRYDVRVSPMTRGYNGVHVNSEHTIPGMLTSDISIGTACVITADFVNVGMSFIYLRCV